MGTVDGGLIGVSDRVIYLASESHVEGFLSEDVGIEASWDVGLAEVVLAMVRE